MGKGGGSVLPWGCPPSGTIQERCWPPSQQVTTLLSLGWEDHPHTFFLSGGTESCDGCLGWLGFWACLLQARGFVGSPKDLQNSTCMGNRDDFHTCFRAQGHTYCPSAPEPGLQGMQWPPPPLS